MVHATCCSSAERGRAADGAAAIESELTELGASVRIESCDAADRDSLQATPGRDTGRASVDRRHPRRRSARRRRVRGADATSPGRGAASENRCGVEPARTHRVCGPVGVRAVFVGSRCSRLRGPGQLRGRQCIPRRARTASPTAGAAGCLDGVGMVGASDRDDRPSRRARSRAHEP